LSEFPQAVENSEFLSKVQARTLPAASRLTVEKTGDVREGALGHAHLQIPCMSFSHCSRALRRVSEQVRAISAHCSNVLPVSRASPLRTLANHFLRCSVSPAATPPP
jgi:hypothetical protein